MRISAKKIIAGFAGLTATSFLVLVGYKEISGETHVDKQQYILDHAVNMQTQPEAKDVKQDEGKVILK